MSAVFSAQQAFSFFDTMAFVSAPKDLSKIKNKVVFGMTSRQLVCFSTAAVIGIPTYLLTREAIGNTPAVLLMMVIMAPLFLLAMYEPPARRKDTAKLPADEVLSARSSHLSD